MKMPLFLALPIPLLISFIINIKDAYKRFKIFASLKKEQNKKLWISSKVKASWMWKMVLTKNFTQIGKKTNLFYFIIF